MWPLRPLRPPPSLGVPVPLGRTLCERSGLPFHCYSPLHSPRWRPHGTSVRRALQQTRAVEGTSKIQGNAENHAGACGGRPSRPPTIRTTSVTLASRTPPTSDFEALATRAGGHKNANTLRPTRPTSRANASRLSPPGTRPPSTNRLHPAAVRAAQSSTKVRGALSAGAARRLEVKIGRLPMAAASPREPHVKPPSHHLAEIEAVKRPTEAEVLTRCLMPLLQHTLSGDASQVLESSILDLCLEELFAVLRNRAPDCARSCTPSALRPAPH